MRSVRGAAHVFDFKCSAQSVKLTLEFGAIVCPDFGGVPKELEDFFFNCIRHCLAAFVCDESQHAKFTKTANGT